MTETESVNEAMEVSEPICKQEHSEFDLLHTLVHRKSFIMKFTVAVSLIAAVVVLLVPNRYTATTVVLPPAQNSSLGGLLSSQLGGGANSGAALALAGIVGIKSPGEMYVSLFRSRTVEDAVIQRFDLMKRYKEKNLVDTREEFGERTSVVLGLKDGLIRITVWDHDPTMAANIANGYVDEFRRNSSKLAITEAAQRRLFFQQQLVQAKSDLENAEDAMKSTEESTGVLHIDSQAKALIEAGVTLRAQIAAKEVQIQGMRSFATDDNPELVIAKQQLAALKSQLSGLAGTGPDLSGDLVVPKSKIPQAGMEYMRKFRDVKYYESLYELIATQFELAKLDEARQGSITQVTDIAVPPDKKSGPPRTLIVVLASLLAFLCSVLWVRIGDHWKTLILNFNNNKIGEHTSRTHDQ